MQDVFIVCDDTHGLVPWMVIQSINQRSPEQKYNVAGFICDDGKWLEKYNMKGLYKGSIKDIQIDMNACYSLGIMDPKKKRAAVESLRKRGAEIATLISPYALVPQGFTVGTGCLITAKSTIKETAIVKDFVTITGAMLGSSAEVGEYSTISSGANVTCAKIASEVFIGKNAVIMTDHKSIHIGNRSVVCSGSNVINNVKDDQVIMGNPAKKVRIQT